jgi:hypothetical protein
VGARIGWVKDRPPAVVSQFPKWRFIAASRPPWRRRWDRNPAWALLSTRAFRHRVAPATQASQQLVCARSSAVA